MQMKKEFGIFKIRRNCYYPRFTRDLPEIYLRFTRDLPEIYLRFLPNFLVINEKYKSNYPSKK